MAHYISTWHRAFDNSRLLEGMSGGPVFSQSIARCMEVAELVRLWLPGAFLLVLVVVVGTQCLYCKFFNYLLRRQQRLYPDAILLQKEKTPQVIPLIHGIVQRTCECCVNGFVHAMAFANIIGFTLARWCLQAGWVLYRTVKRSIDRTKRLLGWMHERGQGLLLQVLKRQVAHVEQEDALPPPSNPRQSAFQSPPTNVEKSIAAAQPSRRVAFAESDDGHIRETVISFHISEPSTRMSSPQERLRSVSVVATPNRSSRRIRRVQTPPAKVRPTRDGTGKQNEDSDPVSRQLASTADKDYSQQSLVKEQPSPSLTPTTRKTLQAPIVPIRSSTVVSSGQIRRNVRETLVERFARKRQLELTQQEHEHPTQGTEEPLRKRGRIPLTVRPAPQSSIIMTSARKRMQQQRKALIWEQLNKKAKHDSDAENKERQSAAETSGFQVLVPINNQTSFSTKSSAGGASATAVNDTTVPGSLAPQSSFGSGSTVDQAPESGPTAPQPTFTFGSTVNEGATTSAKEPQAASTAFSFGSSVDGAQKADSQAPQSTSTAFSFGSTADGAQKADSQAPQSTFSFGPTANGVSVVGPKAPQPAFTFGSTAENTPAPGPVAAPSQHEGSAIHDQNILTETKTSLDNKASSSSSFTFGAAPPTAGVAGFQEVPQFPSQSAFGSMAPSTPAPAANQGFGSSTLAVGSSSAQPSATFGAPSVSPPSSSTAAPALGFPSAATGTPTSTFQGPTTSFGSTPGPSVSFGSTPSSLEVSNPSFGTSTFGATLGPSFGVTAAPTAGSQGFAGGSAPDAERARASVRHRLALRKGKARR